MVQQADSIQTDAALEAESQQQVLRQHSSQLTPKEVLSWLPKNATPAQQDSMIRAHIKPSEIHWSEMPDTLHLPGHKAGKSFRDVSLPQQSLGHRSEERRVGKECRSRWSPYH